MLASSRLGNGRDRVRAGAPAFTHWYAFLVVLVLVAFTGGASRPDAFSQLLVRGGAFLAIAGWLVWGRTAYRSGLTAPAIFLAFAIVIQLIQLIPLSPGLWQMLPGRAFLHHGDQVAGIAPPWRPIALDPDRAWAAAISMIVPAAALTGLLFLATRVRARLVGPIFFLSVASAILGLVQLSAGTGTAMRWYAYTNDQSAVGFLANRNHNALLLALGLPFGAVWALLHERRDRPWPQGWVALGASAFILMMLPAVGSRMGLVLGAIGTVAGLALAMPAIWPRFSRLRRRRRRQIAIGTAVAVIAFAAVLIAFGRNEAVLRLRDLDSAGDLRVEAFPIILALAKSFLPFGAGAGGFDVAFRHVEPNAMLSTIYLNQAHNDLVQLLLEGGVLAVAGAVAFVLWWGWATVQLFRHTGSSVVRAGRAGTVAIFMSLLASSTDYPLRTPLMLFLFVVAATLVATGASASAAGLDERDDALRRPES